MRVQTFVEKINSVAPSIEQIMRESNTLDNSVAESLQESFLLTYNPPNEEVGLLDELISYTSIYNTGLSGINFFDEISLQNDIYRHFANYNDHFDFCQRLSDSKIVLIDIDTQVEEILCNNISEFLDFLFLLANLDTHVLYSVPLEKDFKDKLKSLISKGFSIKWIKILMPDLGSEFY
jgi:hypothetical protein